jgi:hypothetical protein
MFIVRLLSFFSTTKQKVSPEYKEAVIFFGVYITALCLCVEELEFCYGKERLENVAHP